jgi:demethylmenaquinone methyltransferase / 2-methoxy-6-polyprenyl-1,4-benzoquinol methylase
MGNKFFVSGPDRAAKVRDLFTSIAPRYDLINDLQSFGLHRYWKRRLIQLARPAPHELALDVCCGTGDITFALAKQARAALGLDFTLPMLEVARRRTRSRPLLFVQGDALSLPFSGNSFDVVTIGYGLRNLSQLDQGLQELLRVTKPNGRILILDFGKPEHPLWRKLYFSYLSLFVPLFGRLFCGQPEAYSYILESLLHYPAQLGVQAKMKELHCSDVKVLNFLGGIMSIIYGVKREDGNADRV